VLVVEDNDINQQIACGILERLGAQVGVADNGRIAVDTLNATPDAFDVVLMDLQMPEMDGLEATRRIRQNPRLARLPVIAMTAHAMVDQRRRCLEVGMNDHVAKPIVLEHLVESILRHTRGGGGTALAPQPPATGDLPPLPGLNVAAALRRVGNDAAEYLSLLRHFTRSQADCPQRIDDALAAGDAPTAERLAHTLRGTAANLGATALQEAAAAVEAALREGRPSDAARSTLHIKLNALQELLARSLPPEAETETGRRLSDEEFSAALQELTRLVESSDGTAPSYFKKIRADIAARLGSDAAGEIAGALQAYDYDQALACLLSPHSQPNGT
jgi:two-component system sensor histidine kinase/response regulator